MITEEAAMDKRMKTFRLVQKICLVLLFLALNIGAYAWYQSGYSWEDIWTFVSGSAIGEVAAILGFYCLKTVVWVIPVNALYLGAGFLLPVWAAILVTYTGILLDLSITFFLGRQVGKTSIMDAISSKKAGKWLLDEAEKNSYFASFIIRMLPGPPIELANMFFGTLDMQFGKFILISMLGFTPGMLPVIFMGKSVTDPLSKEFLLPMTVSLIVAVISILIYFFYVKKRSNSDGGTPI